MSILGDSYDAGYDDGFRDGEYEGRSQIEDKIYALEQIITDLEAELSACRKDARY